MTAHCETARSTLYTDPQGRAWESFWLGSGPETTYVFRNQIPDTESWTRTHPGWVLSDGRYCTWQRTPPPRIREALPNNGTAASFMCSISVTKSPLNLTTTPTLI